MNKKQSQSGSAHLIIILVLLLALVGSLGFVFYQNFIAKNTQNQVQQSVENIAKYKTFKDDKYNISFQYPDKWTLGQIKASDTERPYSNRSMDVKNENGETVATLVLGVGGLGGYCETDADTSSYNVIESETSSIITTKKVAMNFITRYDEKDKNYDIIYGLNDKYTDVKVYDHICIFANTFDSGLSFNEYDNSGISFGTGVTDSVDQKVFSSLEDAKKYLASDEYKEIKKMILSLTIGQ